MADTNDNDRVYLVDPSRIIRLADDESEHITTEFVRTDDPDKYIMRISTPLPRLYFKQGAITIGKPRL